MELNLVIVTILETLLAAEGRIAVLDLTQRLGISRRTLNYNVNKLNYALEQEDFPLIQPAEQHLTLDVSRSDELMAWLKGQPLTSYVLSSDERRLLITLSAALAGEQTTLDGLCELMSVSRNTVLNDIAELRQEYEASGVSLTSRGRMGYQISGDELALRYSVYEHLTRTGTSFTRSLSERVLLTAARTKGIPAESSGALFDWLRDLICRSENFVGGWYSHNSIAEISDYILLVICRAGKGNLYLDGDELSETMEYQMALEMSRRLREQGIDLPEQEEYYLTTILLGAKLYSYSEVACQDKVDLRSFAAELIESFEAKACVRFNNREQLVDQFIVHLRPLYYRLKYRVKVRNLIYGEIRREYQGIYDLTRMAVNDFEKRYGITIPEEELAYISVYLLTWLKRQRLSAEQGESRILIICGAGVGTSLLLRQQISEILGMGYSYETRDVRELEKLDLNRYDLVVTTVNEPIPCRRLLKTAPILTTRQKERLLEWSCAKPRQDAVQSRVEQVLSAVETHGSIHDRMGLMIDLRQMFERDNAAEQGPGLWNVLTPEMVRICTRRLDAPQGMQYACERLVSHGLVGPEYAEAVLEIIEQLGLYAEISPGVLLAHAKPDIGVHGVGLSLSIFREQIEFPKWGKGIAAVFTLCTPDNQSHLRVLRELMILLGSENVRNTLVACPYQSPERLHRFLQRTGV